MLKLCLLLTDLFSYDAHPFALRQGELKTAIAARTVSRTCLPASACWPLRSCSSPRISHRRLPVTLTWMTPVPSRQCHHDPAAAQGPHLVPLPHVPPSPPTHLPGTPLQALRTPPSESEHRSPRCPRPSQRPGASAKVGLVGLRKPKRMEARTMREARVTLGAPVRQKVPTLFEFPPASRLGRSGRGAVAVARPGPEERHATLAVHSRRPSGHSALRC